MGITLTKNPKYMKEKNIESYFLGIFKFILFSFNEISSLTTAFSLL